MFIVHFSRIGHFDGTVGGSKPSVLQKASFGKLTSFMLTLVHKGIQYYMYYKLFFKIHFYFYQSNVCTAFECNSTEKQALKNVTPSPSFCLLPPPELAAFTLDTSGVSLFLTNVLRLLLPDTSIFAVATWHSLPLPLLVLAGS